MIGVTVRTYPLTKEDAQAFGLPSTNGAVLATVAEGQPASKAGLQRGDVVTEFNGKPVSDSDALVAMVISTKPGTTVPLTVYRGGKRQSMNITIGELDLEAEQGTQTARQDPDAEPTSTGFGMEIEPITPEDRTRAGTAARQGRRDRQQRDAAAARPTTPASSRTTSSSRSTACRSAMSAR